MWRHLAAVLRGHGPDRLGFWSLGPVHLSRRTVYIDEGWRVATTLSLRLGDLVDTSTWLEPSKEQ